MPRLPRAFNWRVTQNESPPCCAHPCKYFGLSVTSPHGSRQRCDIPQTLYKVPDPLRERSELYTVHAEEHPEATDPQKRWVVTERHGYWDQASGTFVHPVKTLYPDAKHCLTIEEAHAEIEMQVRARAQSGFKYLFEWSPFGPPFCNRYEIMPDGTHKKLLFEQL
jgi:hypothetical protein